MGDIGTHRVVILGSGFGGLFAARALRGAKVAVTVIDRTNHHLFQPLLYQVATGILSTGEMAPATGDVLARQKNVTVLLGEVTAVDLERKVVVSQVLDQRTETAFDSLIVATGSTTSYFGHDQLEAFAPGLKTLDDALELRTRILGAFETAELDAEHRQAWLTFVVVGGGASGVEMAGQIADLSRRTLTRDFRNFAPAAAKILLVEGSDRILGSFGDHLSGKAADELERLGIELHLNTVVADLDRDGAVLRAKDGTTMRVTSMVKVWTAGVAGSAVGGMVAAAAGVELDHRGRVPVSPTLLLAGRDDVWVIGDLMALDLPGVAETAMQSGIYAARAVRRRAAGGATTHADPFRYHDLGSMASVARFRAVASIGPFRVAGFPGWVLWAFVHLTFLTGFKNRFSALAHWAVSFLGRGRAERAITAGQLSAGERPKGDPPAS